MSSSMRLRNKVAIVTGSGRGIGRAIAETFASEGAKVVVTARTEPQVNETCECIRNHGGSALACVCDLRDQNQVETMVRISSINGVRYRRKTFGQTQYNASKAALDNLTKGLAMELAPYSILVNAIAPGFVQTQMAETDPLAEDSFKTEYLESGRIPLGRYGTPQDCANLALFLASDECIWLTGEVIHQDGGLNFVF